MKRAGIMYLVAVLISLIGVLASWPTAPHEATGAQGGLEKVPQYKVDPSWPKSLPNKWLLGEVAGVAVDSRDRIWIVQRPRDEAGAPPVMELDSDGNVIQSWGGPGGGYEWPQSEHGIFVDYKGNVWIAGNGGGDHQVLKFSRDGTFLLQIGQAGKTGGSNDTKLLGRPADMAVDPETNEVYVADGYGNKRVIVFDADTGAYKRHWGAYGNKPDDSDSGPYDPNAPAPKQFRSPVHAVRISNDGLVYISDRVNNRIQVFRKDGTFVKEVFIAKKTLGMGSTWDVDFSPDRGQRILFNVDGSNQQFSVLSRKNLRVLDTFGSDGNDPGQFHWLHNIAVDSKGNIYTGEVNTGRRAQKLVYQGESAG